MFRRTQDPPRGEATFGYGAVALFGGPSQVLRLIAPAPTLESYNPKEQALWFGLFPFRSPLLRESIFLSLPAGT